MTSIPAKDLQAITAEGGNTQSDNQVTKNRSKRTYN
ncbi:MAG: hypothetical protein ACI96L_000468 [Paracoccaceae bacterium]|jgi:hypothetical protein